MAKPETPENLVVNRDPETEYIFNISWSPSSIDQITKSNVSSHTDTLVKYAVYRVDSGTAPNEAEEMTKYYNLIEVTGDTTFTDVTPPSENGYWYFVTAASRNNVESDPTPAKEGGIVVSTEEESELVKEFELSQNYPNPFNPTTVISFRLTESGFTTLKVYDMLGREVSTLLNENMTSGTHDVSFNGSNLSSGIYIYQLSSKGNTITRRMTLIK